MTAPIVTVRGEAELHGPADLATLTCTLHASGDSAEAVRGQLATGSQSVAELLGRFTSALERHSSSGLQVSPEFHRRTPGKITGYRGSFSTTIVVIDVEALSPLILGLSGLPSSQLDGPWWSLRPDNPMFRAVRLAAIADARRRAEDYAAAFGATVAELVEVSDIDPSFAPGPMRMAAAKETDFDNETLAFEPAEQTVSGQVTVRFTIRGGSAGG
jgi:uncharacterized protein